MSNKWENPDSARQMTYKFNQLVDKVEEMAKNDKNVGKLITDILETLTAKIDQATAKKDLQLDNVDNTSDMDKPLSNPQARALETATEFMLTSEPIKNIDVGKPPLGVISKLKILDNKLVIDTDTGAVNQNVNVFITNNKLVFIRL